MRKSITIRLGLVPIFLLAMLVPSVSFAAPPEALGAADAAFSRGQADNALRVVDSELQTDSSSAAAWNLQCRIYLSQGHWDDAINSCRHAVQLAPSSSEYHVWLGRAYGEKASRSKMFAAYQTAKLVRSEFETAVALDAHNVEALSDLGQYYVQAPHMLGGGYDKAEGMAERLDSLDAARADELRALISEAKKDYAAAEQSWRARIALSKSSAEAAAQAWMDLGSFYRRRGRWDDMLSALKSGAATDTSHGPALVDGASTLIAANREPALAAQWLREYLTGKSLSQTAPAFVVHAELGALLKKQGDAPGADREFAAAHALSANYVETATVHTGD